MPLSSGDMFGVGQGGAGDRPDSGSHLPCQDLRAWGSESPPSPDCPVESAEFIEDLGSGTLPVRCSPRSLVPRFPTGTEHGKPETPCPP